MTIGIEKGSGMFAAKDKGPEDIPSGPVGSTDYGSYLLVVKTIR
jgi:hypothetical protein